MDVAGLVLLKPDSFCLLRAGQGPLFYFLPTCLTELMSHKELTYLSASEALGLFRSRKLSPVELLDAILQRSEDISPLINPFADCYFDEARAAARSAELEYVKPRGFPVIF